MYVSLRPSRLRSVDPSVVQNDARPRGRVSGNVMLLGLTSLVTDVSAEMVTAVLPLYLVLEVGFSPVQLGAFDGLYQGITAAVGIAGAVVADRRRRYKEIAGLGYGVSAGCKLGLLASAGAWLPTTAILYLDRAGKGVRTAPRDALISLSSAASSFGAAFGVHRALDTAGALLGPVAAFAVLAAAPDGYDAVFVASFCLGLIGLAILGLFVDGRPAAPDQPHGERVSFGSAVRLLHVPGVRRVAAAATVFGAVSVGDALIYLSVQQRADFDLRFFPLLYVGTAVAYLCLAVPFGRLADAVGRGRVYLGGQVLLLAVYALLFSGHMGAVQVLLLLALLGAFYAATDGVLAALASSLLPTGSRASGLAVITTATTAARVLGSLAFGALWSWYGPRTGVVVFVLALAVALPVGGRLLLQGRPA